MDKLANNDSLRHALHGISEVAKQLLLLAGIHQAEQIVRLDIIIHTFTRLGDVEAVEVHDLVPGCHEVTHKLFLVVILGIDLGQGA